MGDWEDLVTISPVFMLLGLVLIAGYLAPYVMGKIDDLGMKQRRETMEKDVN